MQLQSRNSFERYVCADMHESVWKKLWVPNCDDVTDTIGKTGIFIYFFLLDQHVIGVSVLLASF